MFMVNECTFSVLYYMSTSCKINVEYLYIYYNVYKYCEYENSELLKKKNGKNLITITGVECFPHSNIICETTSKRRRTL